MKQRVRVWCLLALIVAMLGFIISQWDVEVRLNGEPEMTIPLGVMFQDPGAAAAFVGKDTDLLDKPVKVRTRGVVDTQTPGDYTVKYGAGWLFYHGKAERVVHVADMTPPVITLADVETVIEQDGVFQDGYQALDDTDGDLTDLVSVQGYVDTAKAGTYELTYTVADSAGNLGTATRTVKVLGEVDPVTGTKIVFLTFDDGPGPYTSELLDVLARHGAKATFFVTAAFPEYQDCIRREAEEGHAVAVHCYNHDYDVVYASDDAYWADFERMNDVIEAETGRRTDILRFPGGSSNTVSSGVPGLMTRLAAEVHERGYEYYDWNVDSNDAGGTRTSDGIFENITSGLSRTDISVVLCHDIHDYTVEAMDRVLTWCEENGYTLLPLERGITQCHHGINN